MTFRGMDDIQEDHEGPFGNGPIIQPPFSAYQGKTPEIIQSEEDRVMYLVGNGTKTGTNSETFGHTIDSDNFSEWVEAMK